MVAQPLTAILALKLTVWNGAFNLQYSDLHDESTFPAIGHIPQGCKVLSVVNSHNKVIALVGVIGEKLTDDCRERL
jgi:hypothetical protein